jgi:WD domain, G-beta repeat/Planctomycete cytochrome C
MSRTLDCIASTLILSLGLTLTFLAPTRGDDGKDAAKKKTPAPSAPTVTKSEPQKPPAEKPKPKAPAPVEKPKPKAPAPAEKPKPKAPAPVPVVKPVSFIREVAPILVENCIACHNPRKSESKYVMTTFAQLAKGGQQGEGITLEPGKPDESRLIELIRHDGEPRMPYKQDPLPPEKIATLERWVTQGAKYDGGAPTEDWTIVLRKTQQATVPTAYPVTVPITALEFSRDGSALAASGYHEVTFWKTKDGSLDHRLGGLAERIYDITYSPDGKWMATASGDPGIFGVARLWSVEPNGSVKPVRELVETQDVVFSVAFSSDGKKVAAAGADRTIRVFEVETGKTLVQIEDHADWIFAVAFSPDGKRLASASRDKTSKVFDIEKKESLVTFPGHAQPVYTVSFTPDGKNVATGGEDNRIRVWDPDKDGKQVRNIGGFGGTVFRLRYTPDGQALVVCSADKVVHVLKPSGTSIRKLTGHQDWIYSLAISRDGKTIASGSWDGDVRLWNFADGKLLRNFFAAPGYKPGTTTAAAR